MEQDGTSRKGIRIYGANAHEREGERGYAVFYIYIFLVRKQTLRGRVCPGHISGAKSKWSCDYGISSPETDKIPTSKTTLPL